MSIGTVVTPSESVGKRIRAFAAFAGLSVDVKEGSASTTTLETTDGFSVSEAGAIGNYIASLAPNSTLVGSDPKQTALVYQWSIFADAHIASYNGLILQLVKGAITPYNKPIHTTFHEHLVASLKTLDAHLATRTFLATERISLADISVASELQSAFSTTIDASVRATIPHVLRHFETIVNQPQLKSIFGATVFAEKAIQYVPPAKEKKAEAPKPKAEKPKAEKKPKPAEDDDEDDKPFEEPKAKNPLDDLPKSTFNLEDWKRAYSNKDTRGPGGALEWLYEHFDKEGFSAWRVDFKYNEELTQVFMSSNQIGGFFNRLEASRKYLFGSMGVLGEANNSIISGALIGRGQDVKAVVDCAPDWESYTYEKLDLDNPEQKKFFEAALAWDLEIDGKKWADGKNFK
ncbi:elongation factor 1-gamma [Artomyces pyxidatus]|uniref:Elongation factor 1-gamma n=1 Tax=Artomyces pyxidatus TaxID=48021 RepID=A0ACB8T3A1_9AGAM|nr:elongation factor 1-gamma [Artomyces pyxidatus]